MSAQDSTLFSSLDIGQISLPGRLFKTATAETRGTEDGFATDAVTEFYVPIRPTSPPNWSSLRAAAHR